jgi:transposase
MSAYRPWDVDQPMLLPPSVTEFVPPSHLVHFVRDLAQRELDLSAIHARYSKDPRGNAPYHPGMMTALLVYSYCKGITSSRAIASACEERVDFMALTGMQRPDFRTVSDFRKLHLEALAGLFLQVLVLCRQAGLAKLGHVALDGTKVKANASKRKAMSYARMKQEEPKLAAAVEAMMKDAQTKDDAEDAAHGAELRGDEMPAWAATKKERLAKIREAKTQIEAAAKADAVRILAGRKAKQEAAGHKLSGVEPRAARGEPDPKAQRNFTDPESKILKTGDGYVQGYNAQAAVDAEHQVIVAADVVAQQNDSDQVAPMLDQIEANTGALPREMSADAGYCSEQNLALLEERGVRAYVATGRQKHGAAAAVDEDGKKRGPFAAAMRARLRRGGYRSRYRLRKQTVEPVFGQIKEARGFRRFRLRGHRKVRAEWSIVCTAHNLLKLAAWRVRGARPRR